MPELVAGLAAGLEPALVAGPVAAAIGLSQETGDRDTIVWAFRRLFEELAADRPLVAVIEDIHLAEPTLLELLAHLRDRAGAPLCRIRRAQPDLGIVGGSGQA